MRSNKKDPFVPREVTIDEDVVIVVSDEDVRMYLDPDTARRLAAALNAAARRLAAALNAAAITAEGGSFHIYV